MTRDEKEANAESKRMQKEDDLMIPCNGPRITNGEMVDVQNTLHFLVLLDPQLRMGGVLLGREDEFGLCLFCSSTIWRSSSTIAS